MKRKRVSILAFIMAFILLLYGCNKSVSPTGHIIKDPFGDDVAIPQKITGIIARVNTASYVAAMGKAELIKATYKYMANDKWASYMFPSLSSTVNLTGSPTAESFYELDANFCIWSNRSLNETLRSQGINAFTDKPEDMPQTVRILADIFESPEWAEQWIAYYNDTLNMIRDRTSQINDKKIVYYVHGAGNEGIFHTAAGGTVSEKWILECGCEYATSGTSGFGIDITAEELINIDPDIIVIGGIYYESMEEEFYQSKALSDLKAVKGRQIFNIPVGLIPWDQYGVEYPLLCLWTAKTVYPDVFNDINLVEETRTFYKELCGVSLTKAEVQYMLDGKAPGGGSLLDK